MNVLHDKGFYVCLLIGYLFGSILTAEIVSRFFAKKSAGEIGSGNPGMANIMANVGFGPGVLVLAGDFLKTVAACLLSFAVLKDYRFLTVVLWSGFGALLGHCYPAWKKFRGGKGVAVCCTWMLLYFGPWGALIDLIAGIITFITGYLPLGGIAVPIIAIPFAGAIYGSQAVVFMILAFLAMLPRHMKALKGIGDGSEEKKFEGIKEKIKGRK